MALIIKKRKKLDLITFDVYNDKKKLFTYDECDSDDCEQCVHIEDGFTDKQMLELTVEAIKETPMHNAIYENEKRIWKDLYRVDAFSSLEQLKNTLIAIETTEKSIKKNKKKIEGDANRECFFAFTLLSSIEGYFASKGKDELIETLESDEATLAIFYSPEKDEYSFHSFNFGRWEK